MNIVIPRFLGNVRNAGGYGVDTRGPEVCQDPGLGEEGIRMRERGRKRREEEERRESKRERDGRENE